MQEVAVLASRAVTTQRWFTAVADNVANANTDGYRRVGMQFKEVISRPNGKATASYVADRAAVVSFQPGVLQETGNPLNVALGGEGFFAIDVGGTTQYTRRGHFLLNSEGTVVTPEGHPVLDIAQGPIQVPAGTQSILIAADGTLSTEQGQLAQIGVFTFAKEDLGMLRRAGSTGFVPEGGVAAQAAEFPQLIQGKVETSNVNPVEEMVTMQQASRAYQSAVRTLSSVESLEERAIRALGGQ
jgi:flagellar basal-body rod protein FlgF